MNLHDFTYVFVIIRALLLRFNMLWSTAEGVDEPRVNQVGHL